MSTNPNPKSTKTSTTKDPMAKTPAPLTLTLTLTQGLRVKTIIDVKGRPVQVPGGNSWMDFTNGPLRAALPKFGIDSYKAACCMAATYGPSNASKAGELADRWVQARSLTLAERQASAAAAESFAEAIASVWTGETFPGSRLTPAKLAELHASTQALWAEWSASAEGQAALGRKAEKGLSGTDDPFGLYKSGKARSGAASWAAKIKEDLASAQQKAAEAEAKAAEAEKAREAAEGTVASFRAKLAKRQQATGA